MACDAFQTMADFPSCSVTRGYLMKHGSALTLFPLSGQMALVAMYILRPLPKSELGCANILIITDWFSKSIRTGHF